MEPEIDCTEGCDHAAGFHKWEIEPNPYNKDFDTFVTDDDKEALRAINEAAEQAWDQSTPGSETKITVRMNGSTPSGGAEHD